MYPRSVSRNLEKIESHLIKRNEQDIPDIYVHVIKLSERLRVLNILWILLFMLVHHAMEISNHCETDFIDKFMFLHISLNRNGYNFFLLNCRFEYFLSIESRKNSKN